MEEKKWADLAPPLRMLVCFLQVLPASGFFKVTEPFVVMSIKTT